MTAFVDISSALENNLDDMVEKPAIEWENKPLTEAERADLAIWIRPTLLPGDTIPDTIGSAGSDLNVGIYQIDVFTRSGSTKKTAIEMADKIALQFKHGTKLTYNGVTVEIKTVSIRPAFNDKNGWYMLIVEIVYYSFTARR